MTYAVLSDLHCHNWSLFSSTNSDGVNSRLRITLNEVKRAATELLKVGGNTIAIAGDIFHVRGSVDPEVLNPVQAAIKDVMDMGVSFLAIPGNHDLKGKETTLLGSAIQTLAETHSEKGTFRVLNEATLINTDDDEHSLAFVPWRSSIDDLLEDLYKIKQAAGTPDQVDVFIHAGIDGVLPGMPDHGLSAQTLADYGFKRVFAGHYHNHKILQEGVISIGATTHQTWGDVGSKAGFILVQNDSMRFMDSHAPKFVDVSGYDEDEVALMCDQNYVRFRGSQMSTASIEELREFFVKSGAKGTSIQAPRAQVNQRTGAVTTKTGSITLDQSVGDYVDKAEIPTHIDRAEVKRQAADVLAKSRAVYEEA